MESPCLGGWMIQFMDALCGINSRNRFESPWDHDSFGIICSTPAVHKFHGVPSKRSDSKLRSNGGNWLVARSGATWRSHWIGGVAQKLEIQDASLGCDHRVTKNS